MIKLLTIRPNSYRVRYSFKHIKQVYPKVHFHANVIIQHVNNSDKNISGCETNQYSTLKEHINNLKYRKIKPNSNNELILESKETSTSEQTNDDTPYFKSLINGLMSHTHSHETTAIPHHDHTHLQEHSHAHEHGHSHTHSMNNPLLVMNKEEIRKNAAVRITWVGLGINVGIAISKFFGGIVFHSQALFADSIHALSDMICDFLTLFSVRLAANKPAPNYPNGYGKIETLGSLTVSTILMAAGISIGWSSLCGIVGPIIPHTALEMMNSMGHGHSHGAIDDVTDINAAWIAAASIVAKEWIFRATKKVAVKTHSNVLMANAWHHRADSLTSLVALVTITSGYLCNIQSLDMVGGLLVSGMVVKAGYEGLSVSIKELLDKSIPKDDPRYIMVEDLIKNVFDELPMLANDTTPCRLDDLVVLSAGPDVLAHAKILVTESSESIPENILGITELNALTRHLRNILTANVTNFKKLEIEYITETSSQSLDSSTLYDDAANPEQEKEQQLPQHSHDHSPNHTHFH